MRGNPGMSVTTSQGKKGRTFNSKGLINGKVPVYLFTSFKTHTLKGTPDLVIGVDHAPEAILCDPNSLSIDGYID